MTLPTSLISSGQKQTLDEILQVLNLEIPTTESQSFMKEITVTIRKKNKWDIEKQLGEEEFNKLRRSFDYPSPTVKAFKDVYNRVVPYYQTEILPKLKNGQNILISAHGNSLRALTKYLEGISDEKIADLEIPTGQVIVYQIDSGGKVAHKEIR